MSEPRSTKKSRRVNLLAGIESLTLGSSPRLKRLRAEMRNRDRVTAAWNDTAKALGHAALHVRSRG